jgi:hypothetical protein
LLAKSSVGAGLPPSSRKSPKDRAMIRLAFSFHMAASIHKLPLRIGQEAPMRSSTNFGRIGARGSHDFVLDSATNSAKRRAILAGGSLFL